MQNIATFGFGALVMFGLLATSPLRAAVPSLIEDPHGGPPLWMTVESAKDEMGALRTEQLSQNAEEELDRTVELNQELRQDSSAKKNDGSSPECQSFSRSATGIQLPDLTSRSFLEMAEVALVGKVVSSEQGFFYGQPATLVEVEPDRWLERPAGIPAVDRLYVRFSRAEIEVDGELVCVRNDHYPDQPIPGGRIVLFSEILSERLPLLLNPHSQAVIFERADGTVSLAWERGDFVGQSPTWSSVETWLEESKPGKFGSGRGR